MKRLRTGLAAALSLLALANSQAAMAQNCVTEAEVAALFVYAMPSALESAKNSCDGNLRPGGFFATNGAALIGQYARLQDETWPKAKRALLIFAGSKKVSDATAGSGIGALASLDTSRLLGTLPDNTVRPLIDAIIVQKVAEEIKPKNCRNIERIAQAIAPIDPRTAAVLIATVAGLADLKDPQVCTVE